MTVAKAATDMVDQVVVMPHQGGEQREVCGIAKQDRSRWYP
jgi:ribosomal protein L1